MESYSQYLDNQGHGVMLDDLIGIYIFYMFLSSFTIPAVILIRYQPVTKAEASALLNGIAKWLDS